VLGRVQTKSVYSQRDEVVAIPGKLSPNVIRVGRKTVSTLGIEEHGLKETVALGEVLQLARPDLGRNAIIMYLAVRSKSAMVEVLDKVTLSVEDSHRRPTHTLVL
jgi:hypothetical protein